MKTSVIPSFVLCSCLTACGTLTTKDPIYRGEYFNTVGYSLFTPEGTEEDWCIDVDSLHKGTLPALDPNAQSITAQIVVRGKLGPEDENGGRDLCYRVLAATEILEVTNVSAHARQAAP